MDEARSSSFVYMIGINVVIEKNIHDFANDVQTSLFDEYLQ